LRLDLCLGSMTDAEHRDDRADADDHTQGRQTGTQFIPR
jgi:hypothetical protein